MNDPQIYPVRCADCTFWRHVRENEGTCRRHAPNSVLRAEEVAHWSQTHGNQGCGDGAAGVSPAPGSTCGNCLYWHRPTDGLNPVDRGDMPMSWWALAGICVRHAPRPASEPGARAFWRATHSTDSCGEGAPRRP